MTMWAQRGRLLILIIKYLPFAPFNNQIEYKISVHLQLLPFKTADVEMELKRHPNDIRKKRKVH